MDSFYTSRGCLLMTASAVILYLSIPIIIIIHLLPLPSMGKTGTTTLIFRYAQQ